MSTDEPLFDMLGLGVLAVDELLYVEHYPPPDTKTPVLHREKQAGGLTGTALVATARLGARCAYAGMLGHDQLSQFVAWTFRQEGIDLTHAVWRDDAQPVHSFIIVDVTAHTRNTFSLRGAKTGAAPDAPPAEVIHHTRVLFADHHRITGDGTGGAHRFRGRHTHRRRLGARKRGGLRGIDEVDRAPDSFPRFRRAGCPRHATCGGGQAHPP